MNKLIYIFAQGLRRIGYNFHEDQDPRVKAMQAQIQQLGSIQFKVEVATDGSWVAESTNIEGILTGGTNQHNITEHIKDAIFTYFEIPPYLCDDALMKSSGEALTLGWRIYA